MTKLRCPGQDMRHWKPEDIFAVRCPHCGGEMEFFKDEPALPCPSCQSEVRNPKIDLGCAKWCRFANECLGQMPEAVDKGQTLAKGPDELRKSRADDKRDEEP